MNKPCLILTAVLLLIPLAGQGADIPPPKIELKPTLQGEVSISRQKNFLYRLIDDLDKLISYMEEDIENLESRIDSIAIFESGTRDSDLTSIKAGYESHLKWLFKMKEAFQEGYDSYFTDGKKRRRWVAGTSAMVKGYENFQKRTVKALSHFKNKKVRLNYFLNRQKFLMTETEALRNEIAVIEKMKTSDENYLMSLKNKLWAYQVEMNAIAPYKEEMYLHYLLLIDQLREKRDWLNMKIEEYKALENLAKDLHNDSEEDAPLRYGKLISLYEKGIILLKKKVDLMGAKDWSITPYGDIREVERFNELTDYYELMKSRYDGYKNLLSIQADGFRADMEMNKRAD